MVKKLLVGLMLVASTASAEFTAQEKTELAKIVQTRVDISTILRRFGGDILSNTAITTEANRQLLFSALLETELSSFFCGIAFANLASNHTGGDVSFPPARDVLVASGKQRVNECANGLRSLDPKLAVLDTAVGGNAPIQSARTLAQNAALRLDGFDDSLMFVSWQPSSFPQVVGPHGDYILAQHFIARSNHYFHETLNDIIRYYGQVPVFPSTAYPHLKDGIWQAHFALNHLSRAWGLDAGIALADDNAKILADQAAGSGLRPFDFHRLLLEVEYIFNRGIAHQVAGGSMVLVSGRTAGTGFGTDIGTMGQIFTNMIRVVHQANDLTAIRQWWTAGTTFHNSGDPNGRLVEFYRDFFDFWRDSDAWGASVMLFFHEIPPPPCGAGTHPENGHCVPDDGGVACPEGQACRPPPTACLPALLEFVPIDAQTGQLRCVQQ